MKSALILIDIQNDFVPGGALAVPEGNTVVPVANTLMDCVDPVVATQDWHPADHGSFVSQHPDRSVGEIVDLHGLDQVVWPDHSVENTPGAEFVEGLETGRFHHVVRKGTDARIDSYSGFFDNGHRKATGLEEYLRQQGVTHLVMVGLATDYCVKFTALDAREIGFEVTVVTDGVRGVDLQPGDCERALAEMREAGAATVAAEQLRKRAG